MKSWLVLCALLSAAIVGVQIHKMRWHAESYHVSPDGHLRRSDGPAGAIYDWNSLGGFDSKRDLLQPGDDLELEHVRSKLPLIRNLKGESLQVVRDKRVVAYFRLGQVEFYGAFVLFAALPFLVWAIAFAFLRLTPTRTMS